jgi:hypothetical protein
VPFAEQVGGAVHGRAADLCLAPEVVLGQFAVGVLRLPVDEAFHRVTELLSGRG